MLKTIAIVVFCLLSHLALAQDSTYLEVHFLYGSRPHQNYKTVEEKWFGSILGGHVGIGANYSNQILNFVRNGSFHWFPNKQKPHGNYTQHTEEAFYDHYKTSSDSIRKAIVYIPITPKQKQQFDSISAGYLTRTPYDYALTGMRCAAATYEILAQLNIVPAYSSDSKTARKILYPRKLRTRLFKLAQANNWRVEHEPGTKQRIWDKDRPL
ncbi:hypothetical protein [Pontibacter burrus]|uniref:DUF2459 domain-containing protein n=1 Tax=Pontibacter burrus TaxID=2704466 RepID=A0A6B3LVB6_9BACT|nr:hypothetical protein [Pontibacter burrus]NEM99713.1 hypothetical protein [Pontibacter burrus]